MRHCPAYLGITVNDRLEYEKLFRYDLLISCPPNFNITFFIPNWRGVKPEKTFDLILDDARKPYRVFLTHVLYENASQMLQVITNVSANTQANPNSAFFVVTLVIFLTVLIICLLVYTFAETTPKRRGAWSKEWLRNVVEYDDGKIRIFRLRNFKRRNPMQRALVVVYVFFNLIHCLMFTFTAFSTIFTSRMSVQIATLKNFNNVQTSSSYTARDKLASLERHTATEFQRQTTVWNGAQTACDNYIDDLAAAIRTNFENATNIESIIDRVYGRLSITNVVRNKYNRTLQGFLEELDRYVSEYGVNVEVDLRRTLIGYRGYIRTLGKSPWLMYPQILFNKTTLRPETSPISQRRVRDKMKFEFHTNDMAFTRFLNFQKVDSVYSWLRQFYERYIFQFVY